MADSAFLSRLPVRGAVFESSGQADAFKVPLLDEDGKIDLTLVSNSAKIYDAANTADRLGLTAATPGDFCVQADNNSIYFLKIAAPTQESSWIRLSTVQNSEQDFDSPNFTGVPTAPTPTIETNSTQLATTAFVKNLAADELPEADAGSGNVGNSLKFAREDHVHPTDITRAPLVSPEFTGQPKAPTPDYNESTITRLATVGYVKQQSIDGFIPARGNVNLNNYRIVSLGMPISDRDAATKGYVDAFQGGLTIREPVRAATTVVGGNISLTGSVTTLDGVNLANGDRVLVKNQTNAAQNGIYIVTLGAAWQRADDANSSIEMRNGVYMFVNEGNINAKSAWVLVVSGNVVLNTTPLNFTYFTRQDVDQVQAGLGLLRETNTFVIDPAIVATVSLVATKQNSLVSGSNIKTINNNSLLGSGNISLTESFSASSNIIISSPLTGNLSVTSTSSPAASLSLTGSLGISLTKSDVGLSNVDNTSDVNKPISTATQTALDSKAEIGHTHISEEISSSRGLSSLSEDIQSLLIDIGNVQEDAEFAISGLANKADLVDGKVPSTQLPSFVDDVVEVADEAARPATGETGKIYITLNNNKCWRWGGSIYVEISPSPGSTDSVAEGSTNLYFTNTRAASAAPVQSVVGKTGTVTLTKSDVGLSNVDNTSDADKPLSSAMTSALNDKANVTHASSHMADGEDVVMVDAAIATSTQPRFAGIYYTNGDTDGGRKRYYLVGSDKGIYLAYNTVNNKYTLYENGVSKTTGFTAGIFHPWETTYPNITNNGFSVTQFSLEGMTQKLAETLTSPDWNATSGLSSIVNKPAASDDSPQPIGIYKTLVVAGAGNVEVNGTYTFRGMNGGKPFYNLFDTGDNWAAASIAWDQNQWKIFTGGGDEDYVSNSDVSLPWYATWTANTGSTPVPTVYPNDSGISVDYSRTDHVHPSEPILPAPKITLAGLSPSNTVYSINISTGEQGDAIPLANGPFVFVQDIATELLENNMVYLECVIINKKRTDKTRRSLVVPSPYYGQIVGTPGAFEQTWIHPWPQNFWTRAGRHTIVPAGDTLPVAMNRPNHFKVSQLGQIIPVVDFLNGRFRSTDVRYRDNTAQQQGIALYTPLNTRRNRTIGHKYPYSAIFCPLRIACRYIVWHPELNDGRGQFTVGPLSHIVKIWYSPFPFNVDHYQSSVYGEPTCSINQKYLDGPTMRCWIE